MRRVIISNVYHSSNQSNGQFINRIVQECEELVESGQVILVGDFNIDISKETQYSKKLLKEMKSLGLKKCFNSYRRCTKSSSTTIDLVFSNMSIKTEVIEKPRISDHFMIKVTVPRKVEVEYDNGLYIGYKRDYSNDNKKLYKNVLNDKYRKWKENKKALNVDDVDARVDGVTEVIIESMNEIAPMKRKVIPTLWKNKPWFNRETKQKVYERDSTFCKAKSEKCVDTWNKYRKIRNEVVMELKIAKKIL